MKNLVLIIVLFLWGNAGALLANPQTGLSAEAVLSHVREPFESIHDYTVKIYAEISMPGMDIPPMDVKVYFKKPDRIHLESDGFAILPREGLFLNPETFTEIPRVFRSVEFSMAGRWSWNVFQSNMPLGRAQSTVTTEFSIFWNSSPV